MRNPHRESKRGLVAVRRFETAAVPSADCDVIRSIDSNSLYHCAPGNVKADLREIAGRVRSGSYFTRFMEVYSGIYMPLYDGRIVHVIPVPRVERQPRAGNRQKAHNQAPGQPWGLDFIGMPPQLASCTFDARVKRWGAEFPDSRQLSMVSLSLRYTNYRLIENLSRDEIVRGCDVRRGRRLWESTTKFWLRGRADLLAAH